MLAYPHDIRLQAVHHEPSKTCPRSFLRRCAWSTTVVKSLHSRVRWLSDGLGFTAVAEVIFTSQQRRCDLTGLSIVFGAGSEMRMIAQAITGLPCERSRRRVHGRGLRLNRCWRNTLWILSLCGQAQHTTAIIRWHSSSYHRACYVVLLPLPSSLASSCQSQARGSRLLSHNPFRLHVPNVLHCFRRA